MKSSKLFKDLNEEANDPHFENIKNICSKMPNAVKASEEKFANSYNNFMTFL